jgi:thiamine biosynthesis lipoprotein
MCVVAPKGTIIVPLNPFRMIITVINKRGYSVIFVFIVLFIGWGMTRYRYIQFSGETMGTTYRITVQLPRWQFQSRVKRQVDLQLKELNRSMSTYDDASEISQFNRHDRSPFKISSDFYRVLQHSYGLYTHSGGAWDPTSYPLFMVWKAWINGYDVQGNNVEFPQSAWIKESRGHIGLDQLILLPENHIQKMIPQLQLDLSSIAKGYGVDKIAMLLDGLGSTDYLVEIGGEVAVKGGNPKGKQWQLGIEIPRYDGRQVLYGWIGLNSGLTMASSGDYRQYREFNGQRYSHIIDPRTGYPVTHSVVGVTVVSPECVLSDALATALMVMGIDDGMLLLKKYPLAEALFFVRSKDEKVITRQSSGFPFYNIKEG